ncbi:lipoprotein [Kutzneria albida DSM 43870]|uniref:Lipoprotein n=2 Tax=Kutzneria TaxID=43356 RepID=W5W7D9_9PSEU|nr:lipoprotein [Kutzneria albida DSM 43870]
MTTVTTHPWRRLGNRGDIAEFSLCRPDNEGMIMRLTREGMPRRAVLPLMAAVPASLAASGTALASSRSPRRDLCEPMSTTDADWQPVVDVLGRKGTLSPDRTVYRIPLPRNDLTVTSHGVVIKAGFALGGYATWAMYEDMVLLMGDLVVTEPELQVVTDALQAHGVAQTAVHKHLLEHSPNLWWTHIHAMGDPRALARGLKAALDVTGTPPLGPPGPPRPIDLDTESIDSALGRKGTNDGGIYKFGIGRAETIVEDDYHLPVALGLSTALNFQPLGEGRAAINGDFVMVRKEIQHVIQALRAGGISIIELHNHGLGERPRLFYMHFWAVGDGVTLAHALRPAVDACNLVPPAR